MLFVKCIIAACIKEPLNMNDSASSTSTQPIKFCSASNQEFVIYKERCDYKTQFLSIRQAGLTKFGCGKAPLDLPIKARKKNMALVLSKSSVIPSVS